MIRILHFADLHLGVENYGRLDPSTGLNTRVQDFLSALDAVVDRAIGEEVDAVLFAGDAYKTKDPNVTYQREFARRLARLIGAGIPTVLLTGNHDIPNAMGRATSLDIYDALALDQVKVITKPESFVLSTKSGPLQIVGLPWLHRNRFLEGEDVREKSAEEIEHDLASTVEEWLAKQAAALDPSIPAVALIHASVQGARFGSERNLLLGRDLVLTPSSLDRPEFAYVALGHIHRYQRLSTQRPIFYAGSLERIDFGEESEEKGFLLVEVEPGEARPTFCPWAARPFRTVDVALKGDQPTEQVLAALNAEPYAEAVVRLRVGGTAEQLQRLRMPELITAARDASYFAGLQRITLDEARSREAERWSQGQSIAQVMAHYWITKKVPGGRRQQLLAAAEVLIAEENAV
ncbi:MAG: metallophosphoesterase family protein [Chloroflexota bacterium]